MTMKRLTPSTTKPVHLAASLILGLLLQSNLTAWAQPNPERPDRDRPPGGDAPRMQRPPQGGPPGERPIRAMEGGAGAGNFERFLTEDQRASLRQTMMAQREKNQALMEKIRTARQALMKAALTEDISDEALRTQVEAVAKLEAELQFLRLKSLIEVQPPLSPDQVERILSATTALPQRQLRQPPEDNRAGPRPNRPLPPPGEGDGPRPPRRDTL
jgi:Spy/CpxP family protein refolding chaperone